MRRPNPTTDEYVGSRVRLRRKKLGLTQAALGTSIGVSPQQIQKYEKGENRIGASRLADIAACLSTSVSFYFPDDGVCSQPPTPRRTNLSSVSEGAELLAVFSEIDDPTLRKKILSFVRDLAEQRHARKA